MPLPKLNPLAARSAAALAALTLAGLAHATTTPITAPGQWVEFGVDDLLAQSGGVEWIDTTDGSALAFTFTITAPTVLRVVDAGFAGDTFNVVVNGLSQLTSAVPAAVYSPTQAAVTDFDTAWADARFSRGSWLLSAPGNYTVTGALAQSVTNGGAPLNATIGAVMLAAVPEPGTWALMFAGLGVLGLLAHRRA